MEGTTLGDGTERGSQSVAVEISVLTTLRCLFAPRRGQRVLLAIFHQLTSSLNLRIADDSFSNMANWAISAVIG